MRAFTSKDGDLLSHFDEIDESEAEVENTSLHHHLFKNLTSNKGKIKGVLPLEHFFGFCKTFENVTEPLGFHLTLITTDLPVIVYTTVGDNIKVNFNKLFLFVTILIPDAQTQLLFDDSIKNSFTISFHSWSTDRKIVDTQLQYQLDKGSAQNINSPKYLIAVHQTAATLGAPNTAENVAIFDHLDVRKNHVDVDGVRYPRDGVNVDYELNDYDDQYRDLKLFYKEYVGEELLNPFKSYTDMRKNILTNSLISDFKSIILILRK